MLLVLLLIVQNIIMLQLECTLHISHLPSRRSGNINNIHQRITDEDTLGFCPQQLTFYGSMKEGDID